MRKLLRIYDEIEEKFLVVSLAFTVVLIFIQVVMRYVFNQSLSWSEELARYIFIWQCWLGVSFAFRFDAHISVDLVPDRMKPKNAKILRIIANVITFLFSAFLVYEGFKLVGAMVTRGTVSSGMRIPLWIVYLSLPFSSLMVCLRLALKLSDQFRGLGDHTPEETTQVNVE